MLVSQMIVPWSQPNQKEQSFEAGKMPALPAKTLPFDREAVFVR